MKSMYRGDRNKSFLTCDLRERIEREEICTEQARASELPDVRLMGRSTDMHKRAKWGQCRSIGRST